MGLGDTIAAIATAPGRGGVAIVRVSGSEAFAVAKALTGRAPEPGRIAFSQLRDGDSPIDEAVVLAFAAPRSYTGENVVEFQCHGGMVAPRRVLRAAIAAGARLAHRGEFTERAFLNGRISYEQAEAVLDLIDAKTDRAADAALAGLAGRRQRECRALYEHALELSTTLEHALDVDEGELPREFHGRVGAALEALKTELKTALARANEGKLLREGALVVLAGRPNAGKSSLLNAILEENRAIVSEIPGTTRDSIEEWVDIGGWPVRLVDTAGLRDATDQIEAEGVKRAEELLKKADLIVLLAAETGTDPAEGLILGGGAGSVPREMVIRVQAKCDLGRKAGVINISAKTGEGLDELKAEIARRLAEKAGTDPVEGLILGGSAGSVPSSAGSVTGEMANLLVETMRLLPEGVEDLVLAANGVRQSAEKLGATVGAVYSEDLLDKLFSRFCVGK